MLKIERQPARTRNILIGVDPQHDFVDGSLAVPGAKEIFAPLNEVAAAVRDSGGDVVFTRDWHPAKTPHFDQWPSHCVAGTTGAEFYPALDIRKDDIVISKGTGQTDGYSGVEGFGPHGETLESIITPEKNYENRRIFIGGLATDYCVKATALDLANIYQYDERVKIYLIRDAVRAVNLKLEDEKEALQALHDANIHSLTSAEIKQRFFAKERITL